MPILSDGAVIIESEGTSTELTGILTAFKDAAGWWGGLITAAASVPPGGEIVGRKVRVRASEGAGAAQVSDCVELRGPTPTVQLLLRGEGDAPF